MPCSCSSTAISWASCWFNPLSTCLAAHPLSSNARPAVTILIAFMLFLMPYTCVCSVGFTRLFSSHPFADLVELGRLCLGIAVQRRSLIRRLAEIGGLADNRVDGHDAELSDLAGPLLRSAGGLRSDCDAEFGAFTQHF